MKQPSSIRVSPNRANNGRRVALIIGNSSYSFADPLANPGQDAQAIQEVLERICFEVILGLDLTLHCVADLQDDFERRIKGAEAALLFYAGHGLQVNGKNYLILVDAQIRDNNSS
jgi:uncharacterized caspase-like protein